MLSLSSTAYVELLGRGEQLVARTRIAMEDAMGKGWMAIPRGITSGNYYLRAYTSWMKNSGPEGFAYSLVSVVNPFLPLYHGGNVNLSDSIHKTGKPLNKTPGAKQSGTPLRELGLSIKIGMENSIFKPRERVNVTIGVHDSKNKPVHTHLSASVYLTDTSLVFDSGLNPVGSASMIIPDSGKVLHFPELTGPAVSGRLVEKGSGRPSAGTLVSCSGTNPVSQFQVFRTGPDGRFRFVPRVQQSTADLVFNVADKTALVDILLDDPFENRYLEMPLPPLDLNESQIPYIEQLSINRQVSDQYREPIFLHSDPGTPVQIFSMAHLQRPSILKSISGSRSWKR